MKSTSTFKLGNSSFLVFNFCFMKIKGEIFIMFLPTVLLAYKIKCQINILYKKLQRVIKTLSSCVLLATFTILVGIKY